MKSEKYVDGLKHAKIVKIRVNDDKDRVYPEKSKVCLDRELHISGSLQPRTGRGKRSRHP